MDEGGRLSTTGVLTSWCLLAIGDSAHGGYFSTVAIICVLLGFVVLVASVAGGGSITPPSRRMLGATAVVFVAEAIFLPTEPYLYVHGAGASAIHVLEVATAVAGAAALLLPRRPARMAWALLVALAIATGIATIVVVSVPDIDVWRLLQQSSSGLLHGADVYRQHWVGGIGGLRAVYPYLPATTVVLAPFKWLLGDVRYGLLTASVAGAVVMYRYGAARSSALAALLLVLPGWSLLIARSWTEPLLVLGLAVAILATRAGNKTLMVVGLALALACKQHVVLLVPLFAIWPAFGWRRTGLAIGCAALSVVPWLIAGPGDLWHDAVHANLTLAAEPQALNLTSVLLRQGVHVGFWLVGFSLVASYAFVLWRTPRTVSGLALACATVMWTFDLTNTQTFFNHYTLPLGLLVLAVVTAERPLVS